MNKFNNWDLLDTYPPGLIRCLARRRLQGKRVEALSDDDVAAGAQLPVERIRQISMELSWDNVRVGEMRAFCCGCNFDPTKSLDRNRAKAYAGKRLARFIYLRKSPWWNSVFLPIIKNMAEGV